MVSLPEFPCATSLGIATSPPVVVAPGAPLLVPVVPVEVPVVEVPVSEFVLDVSVEVPVVVLLFVEVVVPAAVVLVEDAGVAVVEGLEPGRVESGPEKSFAIAVLNWKLGLCSND